jgi:MFS transporter, DHA3 family, macrolide efflux protein
MAMIGSNTSSQFQKLWRLPFYFIWIPENISLFAAGLVQFALIWWLTTTTGSALLVSIATAIAIIPKALFNPLIGVIVDRISRRKIMVIARMIVGLLSIFLLFAFIKTIIRPWHIFLVLFVRAFADTFHNKALISSISLMVPDDKLTRIAGLNQAIAGMIMFLTPALGAILLKVSTFSIIIFIDIIGVFLAVAPLMVITIPQVKRISTNTNDHILKSLLSDCMDGISYLFNWPGAIGMLCVSSTINFIMQPYFSLISIVVKNNIHGTEVGFGLLGTSIGLGFSLGGCILGIWQGFHRKMVTSLMGVFFAGVSVFFSGIAVSIGLYPTLVCFFLSGLMMPFCIGPIQALVQSSARKEIQGRVFSIIESVSTIMVPISMILAGKIFETIGPQYWYFGGGLCALLTALLAFFNKRIRNLGTID